jgi:hypothetical protein
MRKATTRRPGRRLIAKVARFAQPILTHIRERVYRTHPNVDEAIKWSMPFFTGMPGNECLLNNEIASITLWLSQTTLSSQPPGEMQ